MRMAEKPLQDAGRQVTQEGRKTLPYVISHREGETDHLWNRGIWGISLRFLLFF